MSEDQDQDKIEYREMTIYEQIHNSIETCFNAAWDRTIQKKIDAYLDSRLCDHIETQKKIDSYDKWFGIIKIGNIFIPATLILIIGAILFLFFIAYKFHGS
jgi:hypothetical protein